MYDVPIIDPSIDTLQRDSNLFIPVAAVDTASLNHPKKNEYDKDINIINLNLHASILLQHRKLMIQLLSMNGISASTLHTI